ncbi:AMP-binding protein [Actinocrinis puniceicyclus]|uniref:AMP-binding protein n=1 Tax=Actinocrinis puniceicyclus TaxID=977794 RepID=A0A8J7WMF5_9ACTN|nr:AMP-binding protein [Actinocrinis puniceicyclus]MBS2962372.1 AMP-binding protein [Actinocrinis puniceicyclus]
MNIVSRIEQRAAAGGWLERPAYHCPDRSWTHAQVHRLAAAAAARLAARGVCAGDRVLLALPDDIGFIAAFLGVARLGAVAVLANPRLAEADHRYLAQDSGACLCVIQGDQLAGRFDRRVDVAALIDPAGAPTPQQVPAAPARPDDPVYIQYTSGTTGRPKGVVHTHADIDDYALSSGEDIIAASPEDVILSVSKLYFAYGFCNSLVFPLYSGASAVLLPHSFDPALTAAAVRRHAVTILFAVPSAYVKLLADDAADAACFKSVRAAVSAGEAMRASLHRELGAILTTSVLDQIGCTEAGQAFCSNTVHQDTPGTLGRPVRGFTLQVRDGEGRPLPDGREGELWVTGPTLVSGYLNRGEAGSAVFADGWFNTRDRVVRNPDGTFTHLGRDDDIEIVGGVNVSPFEIEEVLRRHPAVGEAAVVAVRDELGASRLTAFVVPARGTAPDETWLADQLACLAREHLAPFKVPQAVRVVGDLPRTASGKLRRFVLRGEQRS